MDVRYVTKYRLNQDQAAYSLVVVQYFAKTKEKTIKEIHWSYFFHWHSPFKGGGLVIDQSNHFVTGLY